MLLQEAVPVIESKFGVRITNPRIEQVRDDRLCLFRPFVHDVSRVHAIIGQVDGGDLKEFIVEISEPGQVIIPDVSCQITYEDLSLSDCVEYCFADETPFPSWHIAQISALAVQDFKDKKFKIWEHQLRAPECEAAFRRLLQQGPIRNVYDKFIFPSPDSIANNYKVIDEHSGKVVDLPHQVSRMRIWNASAGEYDEFDPTLVGAPKTQQEAEDYWKQLLEELCELRGKEYIESLLGV
jgi:hypothetical protein